VLESPQFMRISIFIFGGFLALFCGVIGGGAGWLADRLLGYARAAPLAS
jgi:dipeptide/tripeptide permease